MRIVTSVLNDAYEGDFERVLPFLEFIRSHGDIADSIDEAYMTEEHLISLSNFKVEDDTSDK